MLFWTPHFSSWTPHSGWTPRLKQSNPDALKHETVNTSERIKSLEPMSTYTAESRWPRAVPLRSISLSYLFLRETCTAAEIIAHLVKVLVNEISVK